jgi:hypothetical protein
MNTNSLTTPSSQSEGFTYQGLIETEPDGKISATLWGLSECKAIGKNREEAINKLIQLVSDRIKLAEIVSLNIVPDQPQNPWMKFAGMYKDNPLFDEVISYMESERSQVDEETTTGKKTQ